MITIVSHCICLSINIYNDLLVIALGKVSYCRMQKSLLIALVFIGFEIQENSAETPNPCKPREGFWCNRDNHCGESGECIGKDSPIGKPG